MFYPMLLLIYQIDAIERIFLMDMISFGQAISDLNLELFLTIMLVMILFGFGVLVGRWSLRQELSNVQYHQKDVIRQAWWNNFWQGVSTELFGAVITTIGFGLILVVFQQYQSIQNAKIDLILQIGSPDNAIVVEALRVARQKTWLDDGTLRGSNLRKANLSGADLRGADLSGVDLTGAVLSGVDLTGADLSDADLTGANLCGAILVQTNFEDADLAYANMAETFLFQANLTEADLVGVELPYNFKSQDELLSYFKQLSDDGSIPSLDTLWSDSNLDLIPSSTVLPEGVELPDLLNIFAMSVLDVDSITDQEVVDRMEFGLSNTWKEYVEEISTFGSCE